MQFFIQITL